MNNQTESIDYFEHQELLPQSILDIISDYEESEGYETFNEMLERMESAGYTFEIGLDGVPHSLTKINQ